MAHQHPYHAAHLVTASASDSVSLLNLYIDCGPGKSIFAVLQAN